MSPGLLTLSLRRFFVRYQSHQRQQRVRHLFSTSTSPPVVVLHPSLTSSVYRLSQRFSVKSLSRAEGRMAPKGTEDDVLGQPEAESPPMLAFAKITPNAFAPTKGSKLAAGYDLMSAYDIVVPKRGSALVKTDIQIKLPSGTYGRIAPRSGLALKHKLDVGAGVIDEDYRGNVGVILFNHSDEDFSIGKGDRIAQLICQKICYPELEELESLDETERGAEGFGSTGIKKAKVEEVVATEAVV